MARVKQTFDYQCRGIKGNTRGDTIHDQFITLEQLLTTLPLSIGMDIEISMFCVRNLSLYQLTLLLSQNTLCSPKPKTTGTWISTPSKPTSSSTLSSTASPNMSPPVPSSYAPSVPKSASCFPSNNLAGPFFLAMIRAIGNPVI